MKSILTIICLILSTPGFSDFTFEATPWTKSFLETSCTSSLEKISPHAMSHRCCSHPTSQGILLFSTSPHPDWQVDAAAAAGSISSGKIAGRAERLLFSDLKDFPFAMSFYLQASKSQEKRAKNPSFFEMAQETGEVGFGFGKHVYVGKEEYTQVFSYLSGGVGRRAQWGQVEAGLYHSFASNQAIRCSFSHISSLPHHQSFSGYGTVHSSINGISLQYIYRMHPLDIYVQVSKRWVRGGPLHSAEIYKVGLIYPIAL